MLPPLSLMDLSSGGLRNIMSIYTNDNIIPIKDKTMHKNEIIILIHTQNFTTSFSDPPFAAFLTVSPVNQSNIKRTSIIHHNILYCDNPHNLISDIVASTLPINLIILSSQIKLTIH